MKKIPKNCKNKKRCFWGGKITTFCEECEGFEHRRQCKKIKKNKINDNNINRWMCKTWDVSNMYRE